MDQNEAEAFDLLREVVTLARDGRGYKQPLAKLRELLPSAPGVKAALDAWMARELR